jgi:hypothetical protein
LSRETTVLSARASCDCAWPRGPPPPARAPTTTPPRPWTAQPPPPPPRTSLPLRPRHRPESSGSSDSSLGSSDSEEPLPVAVLAPAWGRQHVAGHARHEAVMSIMADAYDPRKISSTWRSLQAATSCSCVLREGGAPRPFRRRLRRRAAGAPAASCSAQPLASEAGSCRLVCELPLRPSSMHRRSRASRSSPASDSLQRLGAQDNDNTANKAVERCWLSLT